MLALPFALAAALILAAPREIVIANEALDPAFADTNAAALARRIEQVARWPKDSLRVKVFVRPREALDHIRKNKSPFAILPIHQFLEGRKALKLDILGRAVGIEGTRPVYWGVARNEPRPYVDVETHPGLRLAFSETYDLQWINVLFEARIRPSTHFEYLEVASATEAVTAVLDKRADLALLHARDWNEVKMRVENKSGLAWVYESAPVPPSPVLATRWAAKADRMRLSDALGRLCKDDGASACGRMTVMYVEPGRADTYAGIITKYETYPR